MLNRQLFAVSLLLAIACTASAQPAPAGPTDLDHFNCYLSPGPLQPRLIWLQDQFDVPRKEIETIQSLTRTFFCNPVQKVYRNTTTRILFSDAHLAIYRLSTQPSIPRVVTIQNQFGTQKIQTGPAEFLAVPSGKSHIVTSVAPQIPPIPSPKELDHFKCYAASGVSVNAPVVLTDQFHTERAEVLHPYLFCNPVVKTVPSPQPCNPFVPCVTGTTPILHPADHLTCYIKTPSAFQGVVIYNNQFVVPGALPTATVSNSELLCVPSFKLQWAEISGATAAGN